MDMQSIMKQARVMQDRMKQMQDDIAEMEVTGESGGGLVKVVMTVRGDMRKIDVAEELMVPGEKETLEDLIIAAVNMARQNGETRIAEETQRMMEEFGLPKDFDLPQF